MLELKFPCKWKLCGGDVRGKKDNARFHLQFLYIEKEGEEQSNSSVAC